MRQPERQHNRKGVRETSNQKYEITDIAHEKYPFLHRIRALRDIRPDIKAGDLGGFVESESNLSTELEDNAWIYDDAVVCNNGYADRGAVPGRAVTPRSSQATVQSTGTCLVMCG